MHSPAPASGSTSISSSLSPAGCPRTRTCASSTPASTSRACPPTTHGVAVGAGQDRYSSGARLGAVVNETVLGVPIQRFESDRLTLAQTLTRTSYFADASLNLPGVRVAGEIGRAQGGRLRATYNSFDGGRARGTDAVVYYALSVRVGA